MFFLIMCLLFLYSNLSAVVPIKRAIIYRAPSSMLGAAEASVLHTSAFFDASDVSYYRSPRGWLSTEKEIKLSEGNSGHRPLGWKAGPGLKPRWTQVNGSGPHLELLPRFASLSSSGPCQPDELLFGGS